MLGAYCLLCYGIAVCGPFDGFCPYVFRYGSVECTDCFLDFSHMLPWTFEAFNGVRFWKCLNEKVLCCRYGNHYRTGICIGSTFAAAARLFSLCHRSDGDHCSQWCDS